MKHVHTAPSLIAASLLALGLLTSAQAQDTAGKYAPRKILYQHGDSPTFQEILQAVTKPSTPRVIDPEVMRKWEKDSKGFYFRLTNREYVIDKNTAALSSKAALAGKPFAFLTAPQIAYGRNIYEIYSDLGYDAVSLLQQEGQQMVALVFHYKAPIKLLDPATRAGKPLFDAKNFRSYVYRPLWGNMFKLLPLIVGVADNSKYPPAQPPKLGWKDEPLALHFQPERQSHFKQLPYALLRSLGGPDWQYRQILENVMSANSHFRGTGTTENTLNPANRLKGVPEFIGPNKYLTDLKEVAVIELGSMEFVEVHPKEKTEGR